MVKLIALVALIATAALGQTNYSDTSIGQRETIEAVSKANGPAAQHALGETASGFATAESDIDNKKSRVDCLSEQNKRKHCAEVLQDGNGIVRFRNGGLMSAEYRRGSSGTTVYPFYTAYKFNNGSLVEIAVSTDTEFSQVVNDLSIRYGKPTKTWSEETQNAMGAKFDLGNATWELANGGRASAQESVVFVVPPDWVSRKANLPEGYVHMTNAIIMSAAELSKSPSPEHHVKF